MKTVIIYESLFGNTQRVAEEFARVAREHGEVEMVPAEEAGADATAGADLVLIGGPTHVHGMSWKATRKIGPAGNGPDGDAPTGDGRGGVGPDGDVATEAEGDRPPGIDAAGPGLREWFHRVGRVDGTPAAAFDTRLDGPEFMTGRASLGISRRLRHHGFDEVAAPKSFVVDKANSLLDGQLARAHEWVSSVYESLVADAVR
jgi:hypothetical protein